MILTAVERNKAVRRSVVSVDIWLDIKLWLQSHWDGDSWAKYKSKWDEVPKTSKHLKPKHLRAGGTGRSMGERGQPGLQDTLSHKIKQKKGG